MNIFTAVMLVVVITTGEGKQDIVDQRPMQDMDACEVALHEFLQHKFPDHVGAKGLKAGCQGKLIEEKPS